jgi:hypothetical protein
MLFSPAMCRLQRSWPGPWACGSRFMTPTAGSSARGLDVHPYVSASSVRCPGGPAVRCRPCSPADPAHRMSRLASRPRSGNGWNPCSHTPPGGLVGAAPRSAMADASHTPLRRRQVRPEVVTWTRSPRVPSGDGTWGSAGLVLLLEAGESENCCHLDDVDRKSRCHKREPWMTMLLSLSKKCRKYGERCLGPELLVVARR